MPAEAREGNVGGAIKTNGKEEGSTAATRNDTPSEGEAALRSLDNFAVALENISTQLKPLFEVPWPTLMSNLRDDERAKLCVTLAYTVNSLYYMLLRTKGVPTKNHRVQIELERIKGYMTRLQVFKGSGPTHSKPPVAVPASKPTFRVDQAASQRMVIAALAGNEEMMEGGRGGEEGEGESKRSEPAKGEEGGGAEQGGKGEMVVREEQGRLKRVKR